MTPEEHITRALLMGRKFKEKGGYYTLPDDTSEFDNFRLDAETLEPITISDAARRNTLADKKGKSFYDIPADER